MTEIKIDWGSGHMILNIENAFPCGLNRAKRLCHLINQYSTQEDKDKLKAYLEECAKLLKEQTKKPNHTKTVENSYYRCMKNIEFLNGGK